MSSSEASTSCTSAGLQDDISSLHLLLPFADSHGCTAPPPTPLATAAAAAAASASTSALPSCLAAAPDSLSLPPAQLESKSAVDHKSGNLSSPPTKEDLDALALYLMQQSLHSTPHLLPSPSLRRKRPSPAGINAAAMRTDNESTMGIMISAEEVDAVSKRYDISVGEVQQVTYSYSGGFSEESKSGIGKACQEVGAFYIDVQDVKSALAKLRRGACVANDASIVEGGRVLISELLASTSHQQQYHALHLDPIAIDAALDKNSRDTILSIANSLLTVSKDILRLLLEHLFAETQAHMKGYSLKPLLFLHDNAKQQLNLVDDVISFTSHHIGSREDNNNVLLLVAIGTQLQTASHGKFKIPFLKAHRNCCSGEVGIHFALIQEQ